MNDRYEARCGCDVFWTSGRRISDWTSAAGLTRSTYGLLVIQPYGRGCISVRLS